jgi:hypothetical protein
MSVRASRWLLHVVILLAVIAATAPVLRNNFIRWDDHYQITQNPDFNPVRLDRMIDYWGGPYVGTLYPVSYNLFGLLAAIGGRSPGAGTLSPTPFHIASILLHLASALLVFAILRLLVSSDVAACAGAVLFAVHPVQVESVAWISGMNTPLFAMWSLLAIWLYLLSVRAKTPDQWRQLLVIWATIAFVLALFSKPAAVVVPFIAGLLGWLLTRRPARQVARVPALWALLSIPIMLITLRIQSGEVVTPTPLWIRPIVAGDAIAFYLRKLIVPMPILADYGRTPRWVQSHPLLWLHTLLPIAVALICWRVRRSYPWLLVGLAVFVVALLPVLGLKSFIVQTTSTVTDRYLYLAMLAPAMVLAFALARARSRAAYVFVIVILAVFLVRSNLRARAWRDELALFEPELRINPRSLVAHKVLGATYAARNDPARAAAHLSEAIRIQPDDPTALYNLANVRLENRQFDQAIPLYRKALEKAPQNVRIRTNLGVALAESGDLAEAEAQFKAALALRPGLREAEAGLGIVRSRAAAAAPSSQPR